MVQVTPKFEVPDTVAVRAMLALVSRDELDGETDTCTGGGGGGGAATVIVALAEAVIPVLASEAVTVTEYTPCVAGAV